MQQPKVAEHSEYVDFWNEILVPKFVRWKHIIVGGLSHHSAAVFPRLDVPEGGRVVDVGCGFGDTAIELARRVGSAGTVLGIDCCDTFLEVGRRDAAAAGIGNVTFVEADVQTYPFEGDFDLCFSRFGTQFFENPVVALRNMRRSLKPGAEMVMIVWRALDENPWVGIPKQVAMRFLPPPGEDARTCGPGPFSMADPETVTKQLEIAGYTDIRFDRVDAPVLVGTTPDEAVALQLDIGPAGEIVREAGELAAAQRPAIEAALKAELARYETAEGVMMQSGSWKVSARNPG
jgi:ubiquinone/menaquinone biosynthesis C-methylase UbiE